MKNRPKARTLLHSSFPALSMALLILASCFVILSPFLYAAHHGGESSTSSTTRSISAPNQAKRPVTVPDAIQMTRFADEYFSSDRVPTKFSPDGKQFVTLLRKGNLERNTNGYSLLLFQTAEVFRSPVPRVLVSFASSSNRPAIKAPTWLDDNDTILFLGENPGEQTQLYSAKCSSGKLERLTDHPTSLTYFASTAKGDRIAYVAELPVSNLVTENTLRNGIHVTSRMSLSDLIKGKSGDDGGEYDDERDLFTEDFKNKKEMKISLHGRIWPEAGIWFSPDGEYAVVQALTPISEVPVTWREYDDNPLQRFLPHRRMISQRASLILRYELVDMRTGTSRVLLDTPIRPYEGSEAMWSPDGRSVLVSGVYLPLNVDDPAERDLRKSHTFLVEVNVPSLDSVKVSDKDLRLIQWDPKTNTVVCEGGRFASVAGKPAAKVYFRKNGEKWSHVAQVDTPEKRTTARPEIVLEEDMNTPPRIIAIDPASGRKSLLMDLNPQFSELAFGKVEEVKWKDTLGNEVTGGLYWPLNYVAGRKYPLVIQTHSWNPDKFWVEGPFTSGYAAQPLAGRSFFVLQAPDPEVDLLSTPEEGPRAMAAYEGAVDYLDRRGLIDRARVGLMGFSRTSFYVVYALTHSGYHFGAAVIADGVSGGFYQYMVFSIVRPGFADDDEGLNGGPPFGEGLSSWMKQSPGFLMDKVQAPLLVQAVSGPLALLSVWDWYSGLSLLGRPVDLLYFPNGAHVLEKPWECMTSQQSSVDWFCFWLKGEEDHDPAKAGQFVLWRELRTESRKTITSADTR